MDYRNHKRRNSFADQNLQKNTGRTQEKLAAYATIAFYKLEQLIEEHHYNIEKLIETSSPDSKKRIAMASPDQKFPTVYLTLEEVKAQLENMKDFKMILESFKNNKPLTILQQTTLLNLYTQPDQEIRAKYTDSYFTPEGIRWFMKNTLPLMQKALVREH